MRITKWDVAQVVVVAIFAAFAAWFIYEPSVLTGINVAMWGFISFQVSQIRAIERDTDRVRRETEEILARWRTQDRAVEVDLDKI